MSLAPESPMKRKLFIWMGSLRSHYPVKKRSKSVVMRYDVSDIVKKVLLEADGKVVAKTLKTS